MSIIVNLSPAEEARLSTEAVQSGLATGDLIVKLLRDHLVSAPKTKEDEVLAKLHQWQKETQTQTLPSVSIHELFAEWAEEDANKTEEEIATADQLWQDFQQGIDKERKKEGMRTIFNV